MKTAEEIAEDYYRDYAKTCPTTTPFKDYIEQRFRYVLKNSCVARVAYDTAMHADVGQNYAMMYAIACLGEQNKLLQSRLLELESLNVPDIETVRLGNIEEFNMKCSDEAWEQLKKMCLEAILPSNASSNNQDEVA